MRKAFGKLEQYHLLKKDPLVCQYLPHTANYSKEQLNFFAQAHPVVFIKHNTSGQGRGVYRLAREEGAFYSLKGYSLQGEKIDQSMTLEDVHKTLQPFERFDRTRPYIIQEGINSVTTDGQHVNIRVHVQRMDGQAIVGGMYGSTAHEENGITNMRRGADAMPMQRLLSRYLNVKPDEQQGILKQLSAVSISAANLIAHQYDCRECGVDLGLDKKLKPFIFEVNITPGIGGFNKMDKRVWKQIIENRKKMSTSL